MPHTLFVRLSLESYPHSRKAGYKHSTMPKKILSHTLLTV